MSLRVAVLGVAWVLGFLGCAVAAQAQERIQPTGTPTWVPKTVTATPVPLTPIETEAKDLGEKLSKIDLTVWTMVREQWSDPEACLKAVDAHLEASQATVQELLQESNVINCTLEEGTKKRRIRLTSNEARKTFIVGYNDAIESLRTLRQEFETKPEARKVLDTVRSRQRAWQNTICEELESVKKPLIVQEPSPLPNRMPVASS